MRVSPLELRFSQFRARSSFRDGKALEESVDLIQTKPIEADQEGDDEASSAPPGCSSSSSSSAPALLLEAPFPAIEVLQLRCKLRGPDGKPLLDSATGGELYDPEEAWFTLDNRRLAVLQKAAVKAWPRRALVDVAVLPPGSLQRQRQLKKFRTFDRGMSIVIGGRHEAEMRRWSWREEVGLQAPAPILQEEDCHVQLRRRRRADERGAAARGDRWSPDERVQSIRPGAEDDSNSGADSPGRARGGLWRFAEGGIALFVVLYIALRLGAQVAMRLFQQLGAIDGGGGVSGAPT